jgi:hypothetical protein
MKVSKELADVLRSTSGEVDGWPQWKRSLDPIGDKSQVNAKDESTLVEKTDSIEDSNAA